ncbi:MAG: tripartite tricarboxylate transporter TctB family protein [Pseudomonadota bacterium]
MPQKQVEIAFCAGFLALLIAGWISLADIPAQARLFPRMIIGFTAFVTLAMGVRAYLALGRGDGDPAWKMFEHLGRWAIAVIALPVYVLGVQSIGYFTSTLIFIPVLAFVLGYRRPLVAIAIALAFDVIIYVVFITVFERRLPADIVVGL